MTDPPSDDRTATDSDSESFGAMLVIHTIESTHCGSGLSGEGVDQLIVRDKHSRWPVIRSKQMKGALRGMCCEAEFCKLHQHESDPDTRSGLRRSKINTESKKVRAAFGPAGTIASEESQSGALKISPARMLAFPVCSHRGVFAWVTCPEVVRQIRCHLMARGLSNLAASLPPPDAIPGPQFDTGDIFCHQEAAVQFDGRVRLGDFMFQTVADSEANGALEKIIVWFDTYVRHDLISGDAFKKRLVMVSDEAFTFFARFATEIVQSNALDYDTKTVLDGQLFSMELLPPETLMYSTLQASDEHRAMNERLSAGDVLEYVQKQLNAQNRLVQFGADESIDRGVSMIKWVPAIPSPASETVET